MVQTGTGHRQRLKDRFNAGDPHALTDVSLLELLMTYAIPQKDVRPLAEQLIAEFGSLDGVLAAEVALLKRVPGVGDAVITVLKLVGHVATRHEPAQDHVALPPADPAPANVTPADPAPTGVPPGAAAKLGTTVTGRGPTATRWRAGGRYIAANMLKPGMVPEMQLALAAYARIRDLAETRRYLLDEGLPQRSRATRGTIAGVINERLASWHPPAWVCRDLMDISAADDLANLKLLLLLHTARQDILLYEIVQQVVVPLWREGVPAISHVDMQRFLDQAAATHPEIAGWSRATRVKLAGNLLTVLRDYGLLVGTATKRIVQPVVTPFAAAHLARLLEAEGVEPAQLPAHPDWVLWLLDPNRIPALLVACQPPEVVLSRDLSRPVPARGPQSPAPPVPARGPQSPAPPVPTWGPRSPAPPDPTWGPQSPASPQSPDPAEENGAHDR